MRTPSTSPCARRVSSLLLAMVACAPSTLEAAVAIHLPLDRRVYQTNEPIPLAVVRSSENALAAGVLSVELAGAGGSRAALRFQVPGAAAEGAEARRTEHVWLDGRLLRPGAYTVKVETDGSRASVDIDVRSHVRRSTFRLIDWGRAQGDAQLPLGEASLGYNLYYGGYGGNDRLIEAGVDWMRCCAMSGGHQMDLRAECDWSDPYVTRGGVVRVVRQALADRRMPNTIGVHFYDEPGLTWHEHPVTRERTPHGIPSQERAYRSAFGVDPPDYSRVDPADPSDLDRWMHWARWKLGFLDAAWKQARLGVSWVRPDFLSVTQSQYGFTAFTDGYYFNVARCLPVVSGHGGYDDWGPGFFNPSWTLEFARARDRAKPCWYLPTWYGSTPSERYRLEQYLCFQTGIQGMMSPPDLDPAHGPSAALDGIVETNQLMARLGTIFTTMPPTRAEVAVLYSLSSSIRAQARDRTVNYSHATAHGEAIVFMYLAAKLIQQPLQPIVEEDVLDGTLAAAHRAVVLGSIQDLDPEVVSGLERFAASGGLVLLAGPAGVSIRGAVDLGVTPAFPDAERIRALRADPSKAAEVVALTSVSKQLDGARPLADALRAALDRAGIRPALASDHPGISATRHDSGDVEYIFAVNATSAPTAADRNAIAPAEATIRIAAGGRRAYDAVRGGAVPELERVEGDLLGRLRFGPGQMRAFALTSRPIGSVRLGTPIVRRDSTVRALPIRLEIGASVMDEAGGLLGGSIPVRVRVVDPTGAIRHEVFRATTNGVLRVELPLAANDPPGNWSVMAEELLARTRDVTAFSLRESRDPGALAGLGWRAVSFGEDPDRVFRFAQVHREVTIVPGDAAFEASAAERLRRDLAPLGIRATIRSALDASRPKAIDPEAARTWVGLAFGRVDPENPAVGHTGFAVDGAAILIGTPETNPLIQHLAEQKFLPFVPREGVFPGRGRGMLAWQRDGIGHGQESVVALAHDAAGMDEAVGSLFEAAMGLEPLTEWRLPADRSLVLPVEPPAPLPEAQVIWRLLLPDGLLALRAEDGKLRALSRDGSLVEIVERESTATRIVAPAEIATAAEDLRGAPDERALAVARALQRPDRMLSTVARGGARVAIGYRGGTLRIVEVDHVAYEQQLDQDISCLAWLDAATLVAGLADGQLVALAVGSGDGASEDRR